MAYIVPGRVKAFSYDIWQTLIIGNPEFTGPRMRLIFDELGYDETVAPTHKLIDAYRSVRIICDHESERIGLDIGIDVRLQMMFVELGFAYPHPGPERLRKIQAKVGKLRLEPRYRPKLIESDLPQTLAKIGDQRMVQGICSNSGMDSREVVVPYLDAVGIWPYIKADMFSSEDGRAKPDEGFFLAMVRALGCEPGEVLHVGNSVTADLGARGAGLHAVLFAPNGSSEHEHIRSMAELIV